MARLEGLARVVRVLRSGEGRVCGGRWEAMQDPDRNELCVEGEE